MYINNEKEFILKYRKVAVPILLAFGFMIITWCRINISILDSTIMQRAAINFGNIFAKVMETWCSNLLSIGKFPKGCNC